MGIDPEKVHTIASSLRYQINLQLGGRRWDIQNWNPLLDGVRAHLVSWQTRYLSIEGRLVLVRSVLSSIPIFHMTVNIMPDGVKRKLHRLFSRFLWGVQHTRK